MENPVQCSGIDEFGEQIRPRSASTKLETEKASSKDPSNAVLFWKDSIVMGAAMTPLPNEFRSSMGTDFPM